MATGECSSTTDHMSFGPVYKKVAVKQWVGQQQSVHVENLCKPYNEGAKDL